MLSARQALALALCFLPQQVAQGGPRIESASGGTALNRSPTKIVLCDGDGPDSSEHGSWGCAIVHRARASFGGTEGDDQGDNGWHDHQREPTFLVHDGFERNRSAGAPLSLSISASSRAWSSR